MKAKKLSNNQLAGVLRTMKSTGISPSSYEQECLEEAAIRLDGIKGCICEEWVKTLFATMAKQLPSVTQKSGKWKVTPMSKIAYCSICDELIKDIPSSIVTQFKYCPNCGCRMVEPQESEDKYGNI